MEEKDLPKRLTKSKVRYWTKKALKIKEKSIQVRYLFVLLAPLFAVGIPLVLGCFYLMLWLLLNHYLDFLLFFSPQVQVLLFFLLLFTVTMLITLPTFGLLIFSLLWAMRRYLGYPRHEEAIFAECFIIANHLRNNERMEAKKSVGLFTANLTQFVRDWFNPKRKVYGPEFDFLRKSKTAICRVLMFANEGLSDLFGNFGLSFLRGEDPTAFAFLKKLVANVQEYGEPPGGFQRIVDAIERYPQSFTLILTILIFIVSLVLALLGYRPPT